MKSLKELEELRNKTWDSVSLRKGKKGARVVVAMGTCGIAAGGRSVVRAFLEEARKGSIKDMTVAQIGCIGNCQLEPIVEVYLPDQEKVTYVKMTPEKVSKVVADHIVKGQPVVSYTIGADGQ